MSTTSIILVNSRLSIEAQDIRGTSTHFVCLDLDELMGGHFSLGMTWDDARTVVTVLQDAIAKYEAETGKVAA
jgi:hypothetical protein